MTKDQKRFEAIEKNLSSLNKKLTLLTESNSDEYTLLVCSNKIRWHHLDEDDPIKLATNEIFNKLEQLNELISGFLHDKKCIKTKPPRGNCKFKNLNDLYYCEQYFFDPKFNQL